MKKILIALLLTTNVCLAQVDEYFNGMDENALKAGISKYVLSKGGLIDHGESYSSDTIRAVENVTINKRKYKYNYVMKLTPDEGGTKLSLIVLESSYGSSPVQASAEIEKQVMNNIKASIKGRFLYGLGFEFDTYTEDGKTYNAPKGKETGIYITAVKYDAQKQGILPGDIIVKINGTATKDIPLDIYSSILSAKTMTDTVNLTLKRGLSTYEVTLKPRLSNTRVF